jgi:hypothetical protein
MKSQRRFGKRTALWSIYLIVAVLLFPSKEMPVPARLQYDLFLKIMSYDRNLAPRTEEVFLIGLAFQGRVRESLQVKEDILASYKASPLQELAGIPVRVVLIDLNKTRLEDALAALRPDALYICPLRAYDLEKISESSRRAGILTLTGVPDYVRGGLSVGVDVVGGRPRILINLPSARAEGADFSSRLLHLATVIK